MDTARVVRDDAPKRARTGDGPDALPSATVSEAVRLLRSLPCIRERCQQIFSLAEQDKLRHFQLDMSKMDDVVSYIQRLLHRDYTSYDDVPFHSRFRHFEAGGVDRVAKLKAMWECDALESARRLIDLVTVSVLLDAGAGDKWKYSEPDGSGRSFGRSEGLGVASFYMFQGGAFSSNATLPHRADSVGLAHMPDDAVMEAFQATGEEEGLNPLVGGRGRTQVLKRLGKAMEEHPAFFEKDGVYRPGNLVDFLLSRARPCPSPAAPGAYSVDVTVVWEVVVYGFESLWPQGRTSLDGRSMGDVWVHSMLGGGGGSGGGGAEGDCSKMIPFHKLSQWMTYSLMEPLREAGISLDNSELMTGLPEYRNGGLLVDLGLLRPKHDDVIGRPHTPDEEVIVEWRALTVVLLDHIFVALKSKLGMSEAEAANFPLVKMLEAGSWKAGREVAREKRGQMGGGPPIQIISDGTVF